MRRCLIALALVGSLLLSGCAGQIAKGVAPKGPGPAEQFHGAWQDRPFQLPDAKLTDTTGQPFNLRTSPSRPVTLVYFGYPDCPDVCAAALSGLAAALHRLAPDVRDDIGVLVIDIAPDPQPAHQARLRTWLNQFDPGFVGLTAPADQVRELAMSLGVEIHPTDAHGVLLHGDQVIAFDRDDAGVLVWTSDVPVDHVAADLTELVAQQRSSRSPGR